MSADSDIICTTRLEVNRCSLTYGQAPCTASQGPGFECYNTFSTCQDTANYDPLKQFIDLQSQDMAPRTIDATGAVRDGIPIVTGYPRYTSTEIKRGEGVAVRGGVQVQCVDFAGPVHSKPDFLDPYYMNRDSAPEGTFWGRFKALFPYISRSPLFIICEKDIEGYTPTVQEYRVESIQGPDAAGKVVIKGRDVLTAIDNDAAQTPLADTAELTAAINPSTTTISITGYNPAAWPAPGVFLCEEEAIYYATFDSGTGAFGGVIRGYGNTNNVSHSAGEECTPARYFENMHVCDVLYEMLTVDCGISASYIPYTDGVDPNAQWDAERSAWLGGYTINRLVTRPTGIAQLLDDLCEQTHINLFYIPELAEIWISATNTGVAGLTAIPISEAQHMLAGTVKMVEKEKRMISQAWAYYNPITQTELSEPSDYGDVDIQINTELESDNAWGNKRLTAFLGSWLYAAGNIAVVTNQRLISERSLPQYEITFQTDYATFLNVGTFINLRTDYFQGPSGQPLEWTWQIIKARDVIPTARREYTAASVRPVIENIRFGNIVNVANEGVEYGAASAGDRDLWGWIAAFDGFNNGDEPYLMS